MDSALGEDDANTLSADAGGRRVRWRREARAAHLLLVIVRIYKTATSVVGRAAPPPIAAPPRARGRLGRAASGETGKGVQYGRAASSGDWRGVLHEARSHLHYEWTRYSRPPPPPLSPLSPEEAEKKACKVLDVSVGAGWSEIKKAYRHKALEFHPDKLRAKLQREPNEEEVAEAARQFNEVQEAHDALERIHAERVEAGI